MHKEKENARIACLDFSLQKAKLQLGVLVVVTDPEKLEDIRQRYVTQPKIKCGLDCQIIIVFISQDV